MPAIMKSFFAIGILVTPIALFVAFLVILMPGDSHQLTWVRGWAAIVGIWAGPFLLCLCTMNYKFTVPLRIDVTNFLPKKRKLAIRLVAKYEKAVKFVAEFYQAYWTADNRIAFACLASIVAAFALSEAPMSLKPFELALTKLAGIVITVFMVLVTIIHHTRLKKANT